MARAHHPHSCIPVARKVLRNIFKIQTDQHGVDGVVVHEAFDLANKDVRIVQSFDALNPVRWKHEKRFSKFFFYLPSRFLINV